MSVRRISLNGLGFEVTDARLEGASHWLMLDRPHEVARLLVEFLSAAAPAAR